MATRSQMRSGRGRRGSQRGAGTINTSLALDPSPRALATRFDHLKKELSDFRPVWDKLIPKLRRHMGRVWMSEGAAAGEKWPPWKESYAKRRPNGAIGVLKGKLLNQLISRGAVGKSKTTLRFGAKAPGARAFHFGVKGGQLARPYVVATPGVMALSASAWDDHIGKVFGEWPIKGKGRASINTMIRRKTV